ncbi:TetR family transcriptional regulator [Anaerofilum sp. BX8]|uniref:TetR family transcriptional regulator n=1 Tax=Anaerofilum hominis TaxID=2763016 RepID=A0A923KYE5_9FIRM|nr:TetR/AcrR family transcriptional regulator [Anaerofilum hominis]MBC5581904.1 TetR family transcriptional regulator [Anaerofilum hominis]
MPRNKHPEETVDRILNTALALFLEKGYEATTVQDIIDHLGGLSKGAIYHHFRSKEEIMIAVGDRLGAENARMLGAVRDDPSLTGREKLVEIFRASLRNPNQEALFKVGLAVKKNPRFLALQLEDIFQVVAPDYIQPILEQGQRDGTIASADPQGLAEVMMLLTNVWLNPMILISTPEKMAQRCRLYNELLRPQLGFELLDEEMLQKYIDYCGWYLRTAEEKGDVAAGGL